MSILAQSESRSIARRKLEEIAVVLRAVRSSPSLAGPSRARYNEPEGAASHLAMDNDFVIDLDAILDAVEKADVITIRFLIVPHRLLIDARHSEREGPLVKLVPRARSLDERFKAIKQLRPRFRVPDKISAVWWPKRVEGLVSSGIWEHILRRVRDTGFPDAAEECQRVLDDLICQERAEILNAVSGAGYQSLWHREC